MNGVSQVYVEVGWNGLFAICLTLGCVALAWVLLQEVRWEKLLRHHLSPRAKLLQLALAVIIDH